MSSFLCNPIRQSTTFFQSPNQRNWFIEGWTHRPIFIHHPRNRSLADGIEAWHFSTQQCSHQNPIVITGVCVCVFARNSCLPKFSPWNPRIPCGAWVSRCTVQALNFTRHFCGMQTRAEDEREWNDAASTGPRCPVTSSPAGYERLSQYR